MNTSELLEKITSNGLFPIRVEGGTEKEESEGMAFIGDFDEFVKAAKVLNAKAVLVFTRILQESDFMYEAEEDLYDEEYDADYEDIDDDDDENAETEYPEEVYLPTILPSISEYKKYIGKECVFKLSLLAEKYTLDYYHYEPWWKELIELREKAIEKIEQKTEESRKKLEEEQLQKQKALIGQLKKLINDKEFTRLPTQHAMKAYAMEKIPELAELDSTILTSEIQELNSRIIAKGLRRR